LIVFEGTFFKFSISVTRIAREVIFNLFCSIFYALSNGAGEKKINV